MSNPHQIRKLLEEYLLMIPTKYWLNFSSVDLEDYMCRMMNNTDPTKTNGIESSFSQRVSGDCYSW
jgi:hypothetical protein